MGYLSCCTFGWHVLVECAMFISSVNMQMCCFSILYCELPLGWLDLADFFCDCVESPLESNLKLSDRAMHMLKFLVFMSNSPYFRVAVSLAP